MIFRQDAGSTLEISGGLPPRRYEVEPRPMLATNSGFNPVQVSKQSCSQS